jgi:hypothetical protein
MTASTRQKTDRFFQLNSVCITTILAIIIVAWNEHTAAEIRANRTTTQPTKSLVFALCILINAQTIAANPIADDQITVLYPDGKNQSKSLFKRDGVEHVQNNVETAPPTIDNPTMIGTPMNK